ncbi:MAG: ABC transporter ATP-binding protein [Thermodesulfobacteriota bacterium]
MSKKILLQARGLKKTFKNVTAVNDISFEMYAGEILGLIGPNGAGKTTTMQMLLDLTTPTAGEVSIFGHTMATHRESILRRVNFSSSYISLPFSLTVEENLKVFARLYGIKKARGKIDELLKIFEIEDIRRDSTRKLSSGQITRVCLAKALLNEPEILFLDEPTASLDPDMADKTRSLLKRLNKEKHISILYTSHNMAEMEELSERIIFMNKGRILATDEPEKLLEKFKAKDLEEVFIKVARQ